MPAVAVIVTALGASTPAAATWSCYPHGGAVPPSSNVNTNGLGDTRANLVVVPLGADGSIDVGCRRPT